MENTPLENTDATVESLAQAIINQQARCRDLYAEYISFGPPGYFAATMISLASLPTI